MICFQTKPNQPKSQKYHISDLDFFISTNSFASKSMKCPLMKNDFDLWSQQTTQSTSNPRFIFFHPKSFKSQKNICAASHINTFRLFFHSSPLFLLKNKTKPGKLISIPSITQFPHRPRHTQLLCADSLLYKYSKLSLPEGIIASSSSCSSGTGGWGARTKMICRRRSFSEVSCFWSIDLPPLRKWK